MDETHHRQETESVRRIGIVGTLAISKKDKPLFFWLGRALFRLNKELLAIQTKGLVGQVRDGFELEGGSVVQLEGNLVEAADRTYAFVDDKLMKALSNRYQDIENREDIVLIWPKDYEELRQVVSDIMGERGIPLP